jgi:hypothetical protein
MMGSINALVLSLGLIAIGLIFSALALAVVVKSLQAWRDAARSKNWPATQGQVTGATIVWSGVRRKFPRPQVQYNYQVNGVVYTGNRVAFEFGHLYTREAVEKIIQRYPVNAPANVYYDPNRPGDSTLEQTHHGVADGWLVGVVLLLSPAALCMALTTLFFTLFAWHMTIGDPGILGIVSFCLFGVFLFYSVNYRTLRIRITAESLKLTFGIFTWTVPLDNIGECRLDDLPALMKYGGAGVSFSTRRPEEVICLIRSQLR